MSASIQFTSWLSRIRLLDDAPVGHGNHDRDLLEFRGLVELTARSLRDAQAPMVVHVDGSWGRGKTSFCRLLDRALTSETESSSSRAAEVRTGWYVASDERIDARNALLAVVARALTEGDAEETAAILRIWGTDADGEGFGGADFESFRSWVGRELGWSKPLGGEPSVVELGLPNQTSRTGDGSHATWKVTVGDPPRRTVVVFVDDLDRCEPARVLEVFDALRSFVTCPGLMFVVAADRDLIRQAFVTTVERLGAAGTRRASDAMEKYIRHRVELPTIPSFSGHLTTQLRELQARLLLDEDIALLRGPGLELTDGVAVLMAQSFRSTMTLRRLKRLLNALVVKLGQAADSLGLLPEDLGEKAYRDAEDALWRPGSLHELARLQVTTRRAAVREEYPRFFLSQLVVETACFMWPELVEDVERDGRELQERIGALTGIGLELGRWPEHKLQNLLAEIVPDPVGVPCTSLAARREFCGFLGKLHGSLEEAGRGAISREAPSPAVHVTAEGEAEEAPASDFLEKRAVRSSAPEPPVEVIHAAPTTSKSGLETRGEQGLRRMHHWIRNVGSDESFLTTEEGVADFLQQLDLLLEARLGHPSFSPDGVLNVALEALRSMPPRMHENVANYLLAVCVTSRRWGRIKAASEFASMAWNATSDWDVRVPAAAYLLDDLARPSSIMMDSTYLDLNLGSGVVTPLQQGIALLQTFTEQPEWFGLDESHLHFVSSALGFAGAALESRGKFPADVYESVLLLREGYVRNFLDSRNLASARGLVRVIQRAEPADEDVLQLIWEVASETSDPELSRNLADLYLSSSYIDAKRRARALYTRLEGSSEWTPATLHNLATLRLQHDHMEAGRYWEMAFRAGYRDSRMLRAFSNFLKRFGDTHAAVLVAAGQNLPEDWHPFGEDPPQSGVHMPPDMGYR